MRNIGILLLLPAIKMPPLIEHAEFGAPDTPVVGVSWADASAYAAWAGGRLPAEVEWEVAATSGDPDVEYPWGAGPPGATQANIDRICDHTTAVACYPSGRTAWGLWDMCGNVWEWCADPWDESSVPPPDDGEHNPLGRGDGAIRPLRGGSFDSFSATGKCRFRGKADVCRDPCRRRLQGSVRRHPWRLTSRTSIVSLIRPSPRSGGASGHRRVIVAALQQSGARRQWTDSRDRS